MNEKAAETFQRLYLGKRTGVLMCGGLQARRAVLFRSGFVVGARSDRNEDRLGEVLIRHGRITKRNFEDASHFIKSGWKMGEILAELHVLDKAEIEKFVRIQLLDIACAVLTHAVSGMTFSDLTSVESSLSTPLSVANVLMEAARRTPKIDKFLKAVRMEERRLGFSSDPLLRFQDIDLSPEEAYILSRIDGQQAAQSLFAVSPLSEEQTARTLLGLLAAGVIEPEGQQRDPEAELVKTGESSTKAAPDEETRRDVERLFEDFHRQDHWEVLGVEQGAAIGHVKQAFYEKARRFHPDRFRKIADPDFQEKVSYVFNRLGEAYETLTSHAKVEDYKKLAEKEAQYEKTRKAWSPPTEADRVQQLARTRHPSEAKALFARAKAAHEQKDYWSTIQLCQEAIEIVSDRAEYYHLLGLALAQNPKWHLDAERNLKIAINLDPWKSVYLVTLAEIYRSAGMTLRAKRLYEQARAFDPKVSIPD